jgi:Na+/H+ antiporter NhaA
MPRGTERVRVPRLRAFLVALAGVVTLGALVFLRRYRSNDRTALALGLLVGGGVCLVVALAWFQRRFGGRAILRRQLWQTGVRSGIIAGISTTVLAVILLAARWALDQRVSPAAEPFGPGFLTALRAFAQQMSLGAVAYLAAGGGVGGLVGLLVAEMIGLAAERLPNQTAPDPGDSGVERPPLRDGR